MRVMDATPFSADWRTSCSAGPPPSSPKSLHNRNHSAANLMRGDGGYCRPVEVLERSTSSQGSSKRIVSCGRNMYVWHTELATLLYASDAASQQRLSGTGRSRGGHGTSRLPTVVPGISCHHTGLSALPSSWRRCRPALCLCHASHNCIWLSMLSHPTQPPTAISHS